MATERRAFVTVTGQLGDYKLLEEDHFQYGKVQ